MIQLRSRREANWLICFSLNYLSFFSSFYLFSLCFTCSWSNIAVNFFYWWKMFWGDKERCKRFGVSQLEGYRCRYLLSQRLFLSNLLCGEEVAKVWKETKQVACNQLVHVKVLTMNTLFSTVISSVVSLKTNLARSECCWKIGLLR